MSQFKQTILIAGSSVLLLLIQLGYYPPLYAGTVSTTIKYVTETHVYLDAGRNSGIEKGDSGDIYKGGEILAQFEVEFVAGNSASGKITSGSSTQLSAGFEAIVHTSDNLPSSETAATVSPTVAVQNAPRINISGTGKKTAASKSRLRGRIGVQYYFQDDLDEFNYDYHQPSVYLNLAISDLISTGYSLKLRMRSRQTGQNLAAENLLNDSWNNRLYELSFNYYEADSRISYSGGRILSRRISGMGHVDGLMFDYQLNQNSGLGIMGGTRPDPSTSNLNTDVTQTGMYYHYERGGWQSSRIAGTVVLAGQYAEGQIDREYVYQQLDYNYGRKFYIYQSSEVNINRGWRKTANDNRLQMTNLLIHARYSITNSLGVSAGYDNRQNIYTYYNRTTPDSLFDDNLRQGYKAGLNLKIMQSFRVNLNTSFRTITGQNSSQFYSLSASYSNFLDTGITMGYRFASYDNDFSRGTQNAMTFSKNILRKNNLVFSLGNNSYNYTGQEQTTGFNWLRIDNYYYFNRKVYFSCSVEMQRGEDQNLNRFYLDIGVRL